MSVFLDVSVLFLTFASGNFCKSWCGPCQMIAPIYKELSNTYDDVVFLKVDVDENPETAANYNVSAMPTFVSRFGSLRMT